MNSFTPNAHLNFARVKMIKALSRIKAELGDELFQFPVLIFNLGLSAVPKWEGELPPALGLDEITDTMSLVYRSNRELRKRVVFLVLHGTQWRLVTESFRILIAHPLWLCFPPFRCTSWQPHLV